MPGVIHSDVTTRICSLQCVLQYAKAIGEGQWASRQSISYTCRYLQTAVKQDAGQQFLKPFLFDMLVHVALPLTFFNQELHTEWSEDPMEVIRRNSAALITVTTDDMYDRRDASVTLIRDIMKTKALASALLDPFMKVLMDIITEFKQCGVHPKYMQLQPPYHMHDFTSVLRFLTSSEICAKVRPVGLQ